MERKGEINVLFVHHGTSIGGAEQSLALLIRNLNKDAFNPTLLVPSAGWLTEQVSDSCAVYHCPMPPVHRPKGLLAWLRFGLTLLKFGWRLFRVLREQQIHLVYCNSIQSRLFAWVPCLVGKVPVVWQVRDVQFPRGLLGYLQNGTSLVVVASDFIQRSLANIKRPIVVIPNAVNLDDWAAYPKELSPPVEALAEGDSFIVCAGQFVDWKRHDCFLDVAELLAPEFPDVKFVILGAVPAGGSSTIRDENVRRIHQSPFRDQLILIEGQSDLRWLFGHMALLVHTALEEPFGRVIIEAMACEKPVVAMRAGGVAELVVDGRSGFLLEPEGSSSTLAEKVRLLLHSETTRQEMGTVGKHLAAEKYNIERQQAQMESVLLEVTDSSQRSTRRPYSFVNDMSD